MTTNRLDKNAINKNRERNNQAQAQNNTTETTETQIKETGVQSETTTSSALNSILNKKKEKKYRTSVYLKPAVFEKLITLNAETGESFTDIIEALLEESLKDISAKPRYVTAYKENLEKKQKNKKNV